MKKKKKIVFVIGAGASVADVSTKSLKSRPPVDKDFFTIAKKSNFKKEVNKICGYMKEVYAFDVLHSNNDSLERVMATIFTDIFDPHLKAEASNIFRELLSLFTVRLARTTNKIDATRGRYLYRMISHLFTKNVVPDNIKIVTFNQDLQIEKIIHKLGETKRWKSLGRIFSFPSCYMLDVPRNRISKPKSRKYDIFEPDNDQNGIKILKLHGSLNWYSTHLSTTPSPKAMFRQNRPIWMTRRKIIETTFKLTRKLRALHALPVIVPPVTHKSGILHNKIRGLWEYAEKVLKSANEVIVFGYSCPPMDFESSNLLQRSLKGNKRISIIDPSSEVLKRYADLLTPDQITYYPSATCFLKSQNRQ